MTTFAPILGPALPGADDETKELEANLKRARHIAATIQKEVWVNEAEAGILINDDNQPVCACIRVTDAAHGYWLYLDDTFGQVLDHE